jgi:hypothetical protein
MARDVFHSQDAGRDLMFSTPKSYQIWLTNAQHTTNILIIGNQQPEWTSWGIGDQNVPEGHLRREVCQRCVVAGGLATQRRSASCSPRRKWAHPGKFTENPEKHVPTNHWVFRLLHSLLAERGYLKQFSLGHWCYWLITCLKADFCKHHPGLLCANHHGIVNGQNLGNSSKQDALTYVNGTDVQKPGYAVTQSTFLQ